MSPRPHPPALPPARQQPQADHSGCDAHPGRPPRHAPQHDRLHERCDHDEHAGDERRPTGARHTRSQSERLEHVAGRQEHARHETGRQRTAVEPPQRRREHRDERDRGHGEAKPEEREDRIGRDRVADHDERGAPHRRDADKGERHEPAAGPLAHETGGAPLAPDPLSAAVTLATSAGRSSLGASLHSFSSR